MTSARSSSSPRDPPRRSTRWSAWCGRARRAPTSSGSRPSRAGERGVRRVRDRPFRELARHRLRHAGCGGFVLVGLIAIWRAAPPGCPETLTYTDGAYAPIGSPSERPRSRASRHLRAGIPDVGRLLVVDGLGRSGRGSLGELGAPPRCVRARVRRRHLPGVPPGRRVTSRRPILLIANPHAGGKPGGPGLSDDPERLLPEALAAALRDRPGGRAPRSRGGMTMPGDLAANGRMPGPMSSPVGTGPCRGRDRAHRPPHRDPRHPGARQLQQHRSWVRPPRHARRGAGGDRAGRAGSIDCGWVVRDDGGLPFFEAAGIGLNAVGFLAASVAERRGWWSALRSPWTGLRLRRTPMRLTMDGRGTGRGRRRSPSATGRTTARLRDLAGGRPDRRDARRRGLPRHEPVGGAHPLPRGRPSPAAVGPADRHASGAAGHDRGHRRALPAHADSIPIGTTPITIEVRPGALLFRA